MIRYRRDVPLDGRDAVDEATAHIRAHLSAVTDPDDRPDVHAHRVRVWTQPHPEPGMVSVIGEIDADPNAPYLHPDYDPDTDHPGIAFHPYSEPGAQRFADRDAFERFQAGSAT